MVEYEWILSVSIAHHDANITLLHNGDVVLYACEERFSREKHDSSLPLTCVSEIKKYTTRLDKLLYTNFSSYPGDDALNILNNLLKDGISFPNSPDCGRTFAADIFPNYVVNSVYHHNHHAACGFYFSPFDEAICLVMDGWGSSASLSYSLEDVGINFDDISPDETTSIYYTNRTSGVKLLRKCAVYDPARTDGLYDIMHRQARSKVLNIKTPYKTVGDFFSTKHNIIPSEHIDIGVMYGVVSAFLGYGELECGKTMGLSSYGEEDDTIPPMFAREESILCNKNLFSQSRILNDEAYPELKEIQNSFKKKANLAYSIQKALEKVFIERVKFIDENYKCKNIVLSGGCALNVVGNSVLVEKFPHMNFFVDPIANDAGQSLGHAIDWYQQRFGSSDNRGKNCYIGPEYPKDELKERVENYVKTSGVTTFREPWTEDDRI